MTRRVLSLAAGLFPLCMALAGCPKPVPVEPPVSPEPAVVVAPAAPVAPPPDVSGAAADPAAFEPSVTPVPAAEDVAKGTRARFNDAVAMLTTGDAGKHQRALDLLQPLAAENEKSGVIQYNIGVAQHLLGQDSEARRSWTRATELEPGLAKAWLNLGILSANEGRPDAALASFQSGSRAAPADVDLRVATIAVLRDLRRYDEAISEAKAALGINTKAIPIYNNLALVYLDTGKLDLAKFVLQKARSDLGADGNAQLHATLGEVFRRQNLPGDALASFRRSLELDPLHVPALLFLANYYMDNRNYVDATPLLERAMAASPRDAGIRVNLGISYRGEKRFEDAIRAYQEALRLDPGNPEPHRNLAVLYGDYMKAYDAAVKSIEDYRRAGGGPPQDLDAWIAALRKEQQKVEESKRKEEDRRKRQEEEERIEVPPPAPTPDPVPTEAPAPTAPPTGTPTEPPTAPPTAPPTEPPTEPTEPPAPVPGTPIQDGSQDPWGGG